MLVWLVDFDGKMENLALMRYATWYKNQGGTVRLKRGAAYPELFEKPDLVCISCIFRWNSSKVIRLVESWGGIAEVGGTGFDIEKRLPEQVASCALDYALYGRKRAVGFISRGCNRACPWCVVHRKEGRLHRVSTAAEIVGDRRSALFLDNNFLDLDDHVRDLKWLAQRQIPIDFNQGLDARLVTKENARWLAKCKWSAGPRISLDSDEQIPAVDEALGLLEKAGISPARVTVFVLIGFHGFESDVRRLLHLRDRWQPWVFPMGFRDLKTGAEPAKGWNLALYRKYKRLIVRLPRCYGVWDDFREAVQRIQGEV